MSAASNADALSPLNNDENEGAESYASVVICPTSILCNNRSQHHNPDEIEAENNDTIDLLNTDEKLDTCDTDETTYRHLSMHIMKRKSMIDSMMNFHIAAATEVPKNEGNVEIVVNLRNKR
jgi:hypothetical protein